MPWLEDKICPRGGSRLWLRDTFGIAMLVLLIVAILFVWEGGDADRYLNDIPGQIASPCMLLAMGFLLALRCGAIDLSVWTVGGLGGLVAARAINADISPGTAIILAGAVGLAVGAFSGAMVVMARIPSVVVTLLVAIAISWAAQSVIDGPGVRVADDTFAEWRIIQNVPIDANGKQVSVDEAVAVQQATIPLLVTRMLIVAGLYAATMFVLLGFDTTARHGVKVGRRLPLFAAMCASGLLSAVGGAMWLIDYSVAPVPTRIIGDMRVIAAALLAGGLLFVGRGRTMLAGICLPVAVLIATVWRQEVWALEIHGYAFQLLILAGMMIVAHLAVIELADPSNTKTKPRLAAAILCGAGVVVVALAAAAVDITSHELLHVAGCSVWALGAAILLAVKIIARRTSAPVSL